MGGRGSSSGGGGGGGGSLLSSLRSGLHDRDLDYMREKESFRSLVPFRDAFAKARAQGISPTKVATTGKYPGGEFPPIKIHVEHSGKMYLNDGRHRYMAAREAGAKAIRAEVTQYGPRGAVKSRRLMVVPLA